jgi:hypothetical protein
MKKEFIVNRQGKDFVLYAGLLDQAHHEGLKRITTALIQAPSGENGQMAICRAEVETDRGVFTGIGDASPENVGRMIAMHTIRMAETRAKARALRDAINVGVTAFEELGDIDEDPSETGSGLSQARGPRAISAIRPTMATAMDMHIAPAPDPARDEVAATDAGAGSSARATQQQIDRLHKLQAALGRPAIVSNDLSTEDAARQITELVRVFNAQSRGAAKLGSR